ncbi:hypothetical protein CISIN_1g042230mg [Citrus sinensis]|uniref:Uncharacterized protein n=1 Tax=Citrus sinensis TaxID=2711 RepID=A0A067EJ24_CITSI|nr:hypothetical protein CISIN_1g042230mg [Citrus sinensis]
MALQDINKSLVRCSQFCMQFLIISFTIDTCSSRRPYRRLHFSVNLHFYLNSTKCEILILVQALLQLDGRLHLSLPVYRILNSLNLLKKFLINNFPHKVKTYVVRA